MKTSSQLEDQIENGDRSVKIRTSVLGFIKTVEETKVVCRYQKSSLNESGAFQRQKLFKGDEVRWMSITQRLRTFGGCRKRKRPFRQCARPC